MRIRLIDDLHMEAGTKYNFRDFGEDVVVAAGDIGRPATAARDLRAFFPNKEVIQVAGNHEYYGGDFYEINDLLHCEAGKYGIYFLDNGTITINTQRFVGATFWTNHPLVAKFHIADFTYIFKHGRCFSIDDAAELNKETLEFLDNTIEYEDIVVTHFMPNQLHTHPRWKGEILNAYFANDYPVYNKLWLHGHTHDWIDVPNQKCAPYGYPRENNHHDYQGMFIDI